MTSSWPSAGGGVCVGGEGGGPNAGSKALKTDHGARMISRLANHGRTQKDVMV